MAARIVSAAQGMAEAVERLRAGALVAFPTETVYGLGADARNAEAVARVFAAKGRPATNPVIVHVADTAAAQSLTHDWSPVANDLAARFWPGALTLVVRKTDAVPEIVTAGGNTVGLRVPNHPVAQELLRRSGVPIAAPSANRSEEVSPTTAQHVADSLAEFVDDLLILDGGACVVGIESTVVDVTGDPLRVLRSGMVIIDGAAVLATLANGEPARAPGQMVRHYAPSVPVIVVASRHLGQECRDGDGIIAWAMGGNGSPYYRLLPGEPHGYAAHFYATLRSLDASGVRRIVIEEPPKTLGWDAIHDRLRRAATPKHTEAKG